MFVVISVAFPLQHVDASASFSWMQKDQYFTFQIQSQHTKPLFVQRTEFIKVVVVSSANDRLTVNEVFYNNVDRIPLILSYDIGSRQSLNDSRKSAWLWVNQADVSDGTVKVDEETTSLVQITSTQWVLSYSSPSGNSSTYYFDISTGLLARALGHYLGPNYDATATVTRIGSGLSGQSVEQPNSSSHVAEGPGVTTKPPGGFRWVPPWYSGSGQTELYGSGIHDKFASVSLDTTTGREYGETGAYAGPGYGDARAQAWVYMWAPPTGSFSVKQTAGYHLKLQYVLNGLATGGILCRPPFGCSFSDGVVWVRSEMFEKSTGISMGAVEANIWDAPPLPSWIWWWTNFYFVMDRDFYLTKGSSYYILDRLWERQIAAAIGILAFAYSRVSFESKFFEADLYPI